MPFRPDCDQCLIPPELRCPKPKKSIMQCLKTVNGLVEPDVSLAALKSLIGTGHDFSYSPQSLKALLDTNAELYTQIEMLTPLYVDHLSNNIVAYAVRFKHGDVIFNP